MNAEGGGPEAGPATRIEPGTKAGSRARGETRAETKAGPTPKARDETGSETKTGPGAEIEPGTKAETRSGTRTGPRTGTKPRSGPAGQETAGRTGVLPLASSHTMAARAATWSGQPIAILRMPSSATASSRPIR